MLKTVSISIFLATLVWACATSTGYESATSESKGHPPVIVDYYAAKVLVPGETWKIYLRAEDQDGDMEYIAAMLYQPGLGYYPTSETYLHENDRAKFVGHLFLDTPEDENLTEDTFNMKIIVRDHSGNRSKVIDLPLKFDEKKYVPPEQRPADFRIAGKHRLGAIMINIKSTESYLDQRDEDD